MKRIRQRSLYCSCGRAKVVALGLCATCYTLKRQDKKDFGGLREAVLERDGYRCRVCSELPEIERLSIGDPPSVHHRMPGVSKMELMITLCTSHHAMVTRTLFLDKSWSALLTLLWREQHPDAHEQLRLDFSIRRASPQAVQLIPEYAANADHGNAAPVERAER